MEQEDTHGDSEQKFDQFIFAQYVHYNIFCVGCFSECISIHTGQAWKICLATVRIEPTTFGILSCPL
jgi:hypothetical protein